MKAEYRQAEKRQAENKQANNRQAEYRQADKLESCIQAGRQGDRDVEASKPEGRADVQAGRHEGRQMWYSQADIQQTQAEYKQVCRRAGKQTYKRADNRLKEVWSSGK